MPASQLLTLLLAASCVAGFAQSAPPSSTTKPFFFSEPPTPSQPQLENAPANKQNGPPIWSNWALVLVAALTALAAIKTLRAIEDQVVEMRNTGKQTDKLIRENIAQSTSLERSVAESARFAAAMESVAKSLEITAEASQQAAIASQQSITNLRQQMRAWLTVIIGSGIPQQRDKNLRFEASPLIVNCKARMNTSIAPRKRLSWAVFTVSAGEMTLAEHAAAVGNRTRGGADVRLLNTEADAGAGMGMFEDLHGAASPDVFARQLKGAAQHYYGAVMRKFLRSLVVNRTRVTKYVRAKLQEFQKSVPAGASGEIRRAAERLRLVAAAGELATAFRLTGWQKGEAFGAARRVLNEWIRSRGTLGGSDVDAGVNAVRAFILRNPSRFEQISPAPHSNGQQSIRDRVGFVKMEGEKPLEYYIFRETFQREVCAGFSWKAVARELRALGHLRCQPPDLTLKPSLPGAYGQEFTA